VRLTMWIEQFFQDVQYACGAAASSSRWSGRRRHVQPREIREEISELIRRQPLVVVGRHQRPGLVDDLDLRAIEHVQLVVGAHHLERIAVLVFEDAGDDGSVSACYAHRLIRRVGDEDLRDRAAVAEHSMQRLGERVHDRRGLARARQVREIGTDQSALALHHVAVRALAFAPEDLFAERGVALGRRVDRRAAKRADVRRDF